MIDAMLAGAPPVFLPPSHNGTLREYYAIARRFVGHETLILPGQWLLSNVPTAHFAHSAQ